MNKETINIYLSLIFKIGITLLLFSTLFLFGNFTTDGFDTPKYLVLLVFAGLMFIMLTLKFTIMDKVVLVRTPLDIPLLLLIVVGMVSTLFSSSPYVALLGNQSKLTGSLATLIVYVLFYLLLVNNLKTIKDIKFVIYLTYIGGGILCLVSLLAYFGVKFLPPDMSQGVNFTPTGSSFTTTAILSLLLPLLLTGILTSKRVFSLKDFHQLTPQFINSSLLALFGITIVLVGTPATYIGASFGTVVAVLISKPNIKSYNPVFALVPVALIILVLILSFIPPVGGVRNPLYEKARGFPREIQQDFISSWKVSISAFRDHPFWGSGPATYLFNFTNYKPIEFNSSKFWNIRFDQPFNEYLYILGTLGGVGLLGLLSLTAMYTSAASKALNIQVAPEHGLSSMERLQLGLAISGLTFFVILLFHTSTLPLWTVALTILACFMVVNLLHLGSARGLFSGLESKNIGQSLLRFAANISSPISSEETVKIDALPGILLVVAICLSLSAFFFGSKFALADYHHRLALIAVGKNDGLKAYNELVLAEGLNPYNDLYRINIAQTNFALANAIAVNKAPSEASPGGSLTDSDRTNIQTLLQQAINEGKTSVELSPRSAVNWEILGNIYRQISGVADNALLFALDSYGKAIFQDPLNPLLRLNVGGTYYATKNYDMAIRFFTDSANLKPDFANAYYNLSVAMRDKGDLINAQSVAEKVLSLVDPNSQDYQIASNYLNDLKKRIQDGTVKQSDIQPPASQTKGALQNKQLPQVVNLPKPTEIASPSAVKRPNSTPEPTPQ